MECPVKEPCPPKCCYPDVRRSNPTCEASGTTALIWEHQSGGGPAEDGRLNENERPLLRSVIGNRPKVLSGRRQNGTRVESSGVSTDDGGNATRRTIGRSLPIRISVLNNRVSPIRPAAARRRYPDRKEGHDGGGRNGGASEGRPVMGRTGPRRRGDTRPERAQTSAMVSTVGKPWIVWDCWRR